MELKFVIYVVELLVVVICLIMLRNVVGVSVLLLKWCGVFV